MPRTRDNNLREQQKKRRGVGASKRKASMAGTTRAKPPHRNNTDKPTPTTDLRK